MLRSNCTIHIVCSPFVKINNQYGIRRCTMCDPMKWFCIEWKMISHCLEYMRGLRFHLLCLLLSILQTASEQLNEIRIEPKIVPHFHKALHAQCSPRRCIQLSWRIDVNVEARFLLISVCDVVRYFRSAIDSNTFCLGQRALFLYFDFALSNGSEAQELPWKHLTKKQNKKLVRVKPFSFLWRGHHWKSLNMEWKTIRWRAKMNFTFFTNSFALLPLTNELFPRQPVTDFCETLEFIIQVKSEVSGASLLRWASHQLLLSSIINSFYTFHLFHKIFFCETLDCELYRIWRRKELKTE